MNFKSRAGYFMERACWRRILATQNVQNLGEILFSHWNNCSIVNFTVISCFKFSQLAFSLSFFSYVLAFSVRQKRPIGEFRISQLNTLPILFYQNNQKRSQDPSLCTQYIRHHCTNLAHLKFRNAGDITAIQWHSKRIESQKLTTNRRKVKWTRKTARTERIATDAYEAPGSKYENPAQART